VLKPEHLQVIQEFNKSVSTMTIENMDPKNKICHPEEQVLTIIVLFKRLTLITTKSSLPNYIITISSYSSNIYS